MADESSSPLKLCSSDFCDSSNYRLKLNIPRIEQEIICLKYTFQMLKQCKRASDVKRYMQGYIILEDKILSLIYLSSRYPMTLNEQEVSYIKIILFVLENYNKFCADFQDTWSDDLWSIYESLRETRADFLDSSSKSKHEIECDASQRLATVTTSAEEEDYCHYLRTVDLESRRFRTQSRPVETRVEKSCYKCNVF